MDAAGIQKKINLGSGVAAKRLGLVCWHLRPYRAAVPLDNASRMGRVMAHFDPDFKFQAKKPNLYGKPIWGAIMDRTHMRSGDYISSPQGMYFLAAKQSLLPSAVVECNVTVAIVRGAGGLTPGINAYSGRSTATDVPLMTGWPASILMGGRTQASRTGLPDDVANKGAQMLIPYWQGVTLRTSDQVRTDQGQTFTLSSAELTDLGWRCDLVLTVT